MTRYDATPGMVGDGAAPAQAPGSLVSRAAEAGPAGGSDPFPATPGMVNDTGPAAVPRQGPRPMDAGMARQLYPDSRRPFVVSDPTTPQTSSEVLRARTGVDLYPATPGMRDDAGEAPQPPADGEPGSTTDPAVASYEVRLPEGITVTDRSQFDEFKGLAVKHGLAPEVAGELVGLHGKALAAAERAQVDAEARTITGWVEQVQRQPEWGEPGRAEAVAAVRELLPPSTRAFLDGPLGNHPEMVRLALSVGRELRRLRGGSGPYNATPGMRA